MFKVVQRFYDRGVYDSAAVARFVVSGAITAAEYEEITGEVCE